MKSILITGGSGFVGKNLVEFFSGKFKIFAPSHQELDLLVEAEVGSYLKKNQPDFVIHSANIGATRKTDKLPIIVDNNVRMFLNLAKQNKAFGRMVFYGSGAEYNKSSDLVNLDEDFQSPLLPATQYGFSKHLCSHFISHYPNILNLRIFGIYGRYDDYENRFISNAICRAVLGLPLVVYQDLLMSFVFVDDLCRITEHFLEAPKPEKFYNISSEKPYSLLEIAALIKKISGKDLEIIVKQPGLGKEYSCSNKRLAQELGDFKFCNLEACLPQLYEWYNQRKDSIDKNKLPV